MDYTNSRDGHGEAGLLMLSFAIGAAAGAGLALLFAPARGSKTRAYLANQAREGQRRVSDAAEKGKQLVNDGRRRAGSAIEQGREKVGELRDRFGEAVAQGRQAYADVKSTASDIASDVRQGYDTAVQHAKTAGRDLSDAAKQTASGTGRVS